MYNLQRFVINLKGISKQTYTVKQLAISNIR